VFPNRSGLKFERFVREGDKSRRLSTDFIQGDIEPPILHRSRIADLSDKSFSKPSQRPKRKEFHVQPGDFREIFSIADTDLPDLA
jgi:hypothetical protein